MIGVIFGTYALDKIEPIIKEIQFKKAGYGVLVSNQGVYLAHGANPELIGKVNLKTGEVADEVKKNLSNPQPIDPRLTAAFSGGCCAEQPGGM